MNKSFMRRACDLLFLLGMTGLGGHLAVADQVLSVTEDSAVMMRLKAPATDVVIANPTVINVTLQSPDHFILIGKTPGRTTLLILDANQQILLNTTVVVSEGNNGLLVVHGPRGSAMSQDSYACAQHCSLIPGSNIGGASGMGSLGANPADMAPKPAANQVTKVDTKYDLKIAPNGKVSGTRTEVPVYGTTGSGVTQ